MIKSTLSYLTKGQYQKILIAIYLPLQVLSLILLDLFSKRLIFRLFID